MAVRANLCDVSLIRKQFAVYSKYGPKLKGVKIDIFGIQ